MAYAFACRDLKIFPDCHYIAWGETIDEVLGLTDDQVNDPETIKRVQALIKKV